MDFIDGRGLVFKYGKSAKAVDGVDIKIKEGDFVAVIGGNGSGKSTLAKLVSALFLPDEGNIYINGKSALDDKNLWEIRKNAGMVFQNPDDQIITSIVEEDIAFGPENLGLKPSETKERISYALEKVNMTQYRKRNINTLSGGEKQKIAIAGVLAMKCRCIIFDEPTSMLDPLSRNEIIDTIMRLKNEGITVILITHYTEEILYADKVIVMDKGKIAAEGTPDEIFSMKGLSAMKIALPPMKELANRLRERGLHINDDIKNYKDMLSCLKKIGITDKKPVMSRAEKRTFGENIIEVKSLVHSYGKIRAVDNVSFDIPKGSFTGIIGHTGSGKSTLIQHINGLEKPDSGKVFFYGKDINADKKNISHIRQNVGLVFQYPETQLFETTVFKDVAFAPLNMGLDEHETKKRVKEALEMVGLDESFYEKMPLSLSGGEKRRAAIAGILAMKPQVIMLDEPTAGLDCAAREIILENIKSLNRIYGITVILITHNIYDIAELADNIIIMKNGRIFMQGTPKEVFSNENIEESGIELPETVKLMAEMKKLNPHIPQDIFTAEKAEKIIYQILKR